MKMKIHRQDGVVYQALPTKRWHYMEKWWGPHRGDFFTYLRTNNCRYIFSSRQVLR